jgi:2,4-dienoyl-CoA reductase-like NADH-dependent reductase (Old Yellow Enzyme family)/thioredoxin reductase
MPHPYPSLFAPLTVAGRTLPNRIALPATLTNYGEHHRVTPRWSDFLVERALGGTGLIVSEIIAVDPEALAHGAIVTGYDEVNEAGFRDVAGRVDATGASLIGQLWHPGRQQLWHPTRSPQGVSDQPDPLSWTVPHVMSTAQVRRLVQAYVDVARRLHRCGFHGVELHGAHGYLITQFLSPWSNTREDDYGGSLVNRARFVEEIAAGIRDACGDGFIIALKLPADEGVRGGIDASEAGKLTQHLVGLGSLDLLTYSQGNFSLSLENHVPDMHFRPGHFLHLHREMRALAAGVPVMALGRIGTPEQAEAAIVSGSGDLVGMSRALISDAAFGDKARSGNAAAIRPCVFNNSCWGEVHAGKPLAEFHNPQLGQPGEASWAPPPARTRRRVVVVGAGPAGLEAAWVSAARGHDVTLFSDSLATGGGLRLEARLPGHAEMARLRDYQLERAREHGVRLELGVRATRDDVLGLSPDTVVVATGASQRRPGFLAPSQRDVLSARELAAAWDPDGTVRRGTAVLYDMDHGAATYAVAEALARMHRHTVLITPRTQIAQGVNYCSALGVHRRLYGLDVTLLPATEPVGYADRTLQISNVFTGQVQTLRDVTLFVYATPRKAVDDLVSALQGRAEVVAVGDCVAPRNLLVAVHEGQLAGLAPA